MTEFEPYIDPTPAQAAAAMDASRSWLASIDRSGLGRFATDEKIIVAVQARERMRREGGKMDSHLGFRLDQEVANVYWEFTLREYASYCAEVFLWWGIYEPDSIGYITERIYHEPYFDEDVDLLRRVYNNPDLLPFYEAGIWDEGFIAQCLENDIDASVALALSV